MERIRFGAADAALHAPYFRFVAANFPRVTAACWQAWADRGCWTDRHEVFALREDGIIVSAIARARMELVADGVPVVGYQLGAVATLASHRMRGLGRVLMDWVLAELETPEQPVILFANAGAEDFDPRFGFRRVPQAQATGLVRPFVPAAPARRCDPDDPADRAFLAGLSARTPAHGAALSVRGHWTVLLWHMGCRGTPVFRLPEREAAVAASVEETLVLHDVVAPAPFDLEAVVPRLTARPVTGVRFRFDPAGWWRDPAVAPMDDAGSVLFVRGVPGRVAGPVQFPALAHV